MQRSPYNRPCWIALLSVLTISAQCSIFAAENVPEAVQRYTDNKAYKVALPLYEKLSRDEPASVKKLCDLAFCLLRTRKTGEAQATVKRALKINPNSAPASYVLALILGKGARYEKALSYIETSINTDPAYPAYRFYKAELLIQTRRFAEARAMLSTIDDNAIPEKAVEQALLLAEDGDLEGGKRQLLDIALKNPDDIGIRFAYVTIVVNSESLQPEEARRALDFMIEVVAKSDTTPMEIAPDCLLYLVLANAQAGVGQFELARAFQKRALKTYESRCGVRKSEFQRALALFSEGKRYIPKTNRGIPE